MKKIFFVLVILVLSLIYCNSDNDFEYHTISGYSSKEYTLTIINITYDGTKKEYIEAGSGFIDIKEKNIINQTGIWNNIRITLIREEGPGAFGTIPFSFIKLIDENDNELASDLAEGENIKIFIEYNL